MPTALRRPRWALIVTFITVFAAAGPAFGQILRIVSWNTANDVGNSGTDSHPVGTAPWTAAPTGVLQAIGSLNVSGFTRPVDILALQESVVNTSGTSPTAQAYANILNSIYPARIHGRHGERLDRRRRHRQRPADGCVPKHDGHAGGTRAGTWLGRG